MFAYCENNPIDRVDNAGCSSSSNKENNAAENEFQTCYINTYGHYYITPCGYISEITSFYEGGYTSFDKDLDTFLLSLGFAELSILFGIETLFSLPFAGITGVLTNHLLPDIQEGTKIYRVIEWEWYNDPFGEGWNKQNGRVYLYRQNSDMTLTVIGRWIIVPNSRYAPNYYWNANGDGWS